MYIIESPILPHPDAAANYHLIGDAEELDAYRAFMCGALILDALREQHRVDAMLGHALMSLLIDGEDIIPAALVPTFDSTAEIARELAREMRDDFWAEARKDLEPGAVVHDDTHHAINAAMSGAEDEGPDEDIIRINRENYLTVLVDGRAVPYIVEDMDDFHNFDTSEGRIVQTLNPPATAWVEIYKVDREGVAPAVMSETPLITLGRFDYRRQFVPLLTFLEE